MSATETPPSGNKKSLIGEMIGQHWTLTERLGRGGIGHVYEALHSDGKRRVAVKLLRKGQDWDDESETLVERFYHEAQILRRLQHPGIIDVYDFGFEEEIGFYLIMELLQGQSLLRYMQTNTGLMPWRLMYRVLSQVCDAMGYAHKREIVHRDLKPEHVFLLGEPNDKVRVKVFDFGIARFHVEKEDERLTQQGVTLGTPRYLSPEQTMGGNIDHRSDIYTLSIILFELLTRRRVFQVDGAFQLMTHHAYIDPPSIDEARPDLTFPKALIELVSAGLAKDPKDRPQSMEDFRKDLFLALQGQPGFELDEDPSEARTDNEPEGPLKVTGSFYMVGKKRRPASPSSSAGLKLVAVSTPPAQKPPQADEAAAEGRELPADTLQAASPRPAAPTKRAPEKPPIDNEIGQAAETMMPLAPAPLLPLPPEEVGLLAPEQEGLLAPDDQERSPLQIRSLEEASSDAVPLVESDLSRPVSKSVKLPSHEEIESLLPPMPSANNAHIDILDDLDDSLDIDEEFSIIEDVDVLGLPTAPTKKPQAAQKPFGSFLIDDLKNNDPEALIDSMDRVASDALKGSEDLISEEFEPEETTGDTMLEAAPSLLAKAPPEEDLPSETSLEESPLSEGASIPLTVDEENEADTMLGPAPSLPPMPTDNGPLDASPHEITGYSETQLPAAPLGVPSPSRPVAKASPSQPRPSAMTNAPGHPAGGSQSPAYAMANGDNPSPQRLQAAQAARASSGPLPADRPSPAPRATPPRQRQPSSHQLRSIPQIYEAPRSTPQRLSTVSQDMLPASSPSQPQMPSVAPHGPLPTAPSSDKWKQPGARNPRPMIRSAMRDDVLQQGNKKKWILIGAGAFVLLAALGLVLYFFVFSS